MDKKIIRIELKRISINELDTYEEWLNEIYQDGYDLEKVIHPDLSYSSPNKDPFENGFAAIHIFKLRK